MSTIIGEIKVCLDCMLTAETSEVPEDHNNTQPEPWTLIPGNEHHLYVMGVQSHGTWCEETNGQENDTCDCGHDTFNIWPCEACGTTLAGDRYTFVQFDS